MTDTTTSRIHTFFEGLGITLQDITIERNQDDVNIRVETPDSALLIGMHGKNIESFQHLLSRMIEKELKEYIHVHLEVNDYMKSKDERLYRFLDSKIAFVQSTGKSLKIANLNAYERKKAHNYIAERAITGLSTHSDGTGAERALFLDYSGPLVTIQKALPQENQTRNQSDELSLSEDGVGI